MKRLGLTMLGTLWVTCVVVVYFWFGAHITDHAGAVGYWVFAWIAAGGLATLPFGLYGTVKTNG